jgi:hypothetical protein
MFVLPLIDPVNTKYAFTDSTFSLTLYNLRVVSLAGNVKSVGLAVLTPWKPTKEEVVCNVKKYPDSANFGFLGKSTSVSVVKPISRRLNVVKLPETYDVEPVA